MGIKDLDYKCSPEEFLKLEETSDVILEYINGYVYAKSSTSINHNTIVNRLNAKIDDYLFEKNKPCKVFSEAIEVLFGENGENAKPDIFVVCKNEKDSFSTKGQSFISTPNLIFEVVSPSNASLDTVVKMELYAKYGVKEYNLVYQEGYIHQYKLNEFGTYYLYKQYNKTDFYKGYIYTDLEINLAQIFRALE